MKTEPSKATTCTQAGCNSPARPARGMCKRCNDQHTLNQVLDRDIYDKAWDAAYRASHEEGLTRRTCLERARRAGAEAIRSQGRTVLNPGAPNSLLAHSPWILEEYPNDPRWAHLVSILPAKARGKLTFTCRSPEHPERIDRTYTHRVSAVPANERVEYCPHCSSVAGYRRTRTGYLYLLRAEVDGLGTVHKFGISNRPKIRLAEHRRNLDWKLVELWKHRDGGVAHDVEALLKAALRSRGEAGLVGEVDQRGYRLSGYSECWMVDTWDAPAETLDTALVLASLETGAEAQQPAAQRGWRKMKKVDDLAAYAPQDALLGA